MLVVKEFHTDLEVEEQRGLADVLVRQKDQGALSVNDYPYCHIAVYDEYLLAEIVAKTGWRRLEISDITCQYGVPLLFAHHTTLRQVLERLREIERVRFFPR